MARPSKGTVDYFPHFINGGKTLFVLESDFGNDGYAFWFKLLEVLGGTEGMIFDWNHSSDRRFLLSKARVDEEKALWIIETLVDVDAIDKELWEKSRLIWCQNLVDNVRDAFKKRISALPQKPELIVSDDGNLPINNVSGDGNSQIELFPVEETGKSKRKENKDKTNTLSPQFEEFWNVYPKRASRVDAEKAWAALEKAKAPIDEIIQAARDYAEECTGKEKQFIKYPATFLRNDRWKDHVKSAQDCGQVQDIEREEAFREWVAAGNDPTEFIYNP
ncbi:Lin1244/Lin1753 domain-containing protein [Paenibacillus contaminans]|uniref:Lin1244/Lin1753 domain-containing protein n=1 Tax=Paenibacillus contaminans TaxID=450362 RepID=UPI001314CF71|nr:Lin1244/Lin1753 domain-containing protein [Paenibacillus contaminans]